MTPCPSLAVDEDPARQDLTVRICQPRRQTAVRVHRVQMTGFDKPCIEQPTTMRDKSCREARKERHMRLRLAVLFVAVFALWICLDGRAQTNAPPVSGAHRFEKVTENIYYATASGTMSVGANSPQRQDQDQRVPEISA